MDLATDFQLAYKDSKKFNTEFTKPYWTKQEWKKLFEEFNKLLEYRTFREIYITLISYAISREHITYGELARSVNRRLGEKIIPVQGSWLGRSLGEILGAINIYEFACNRPLISVIVTTATDKKPGEGFYRLVKMMGLEIRESCERERVFLTWGGYKRT